VPTGLSNQASKFSLVPVDTAGDVTGLCAKYRSTLGPCYRLDPLDMMRGVNLGSTKLVGYNAMADYLCVNDRFRFYSRASRLTKICIPQNDARERFFYRMAQRFWRGAMMAVARYYPKHANLPAVAKIFNDDPFAWVRWLMKQEGVDPFILDLLRPFLTEPGKEHEIKSIADVLNTIHSETEWMLNEALAECLCPSPLQPVLNFAHFAKEVGTCFVNAPLAELDEGFDRWLQVILGCSMSQLQRERGDFGTVFQCDELRQYCSEPISHLISRLFTTGRKYNLAVQIVVTSTKQLEECFPHGRHHDILGQAGAIQIFNVSDPASSEFVRLLGGEQTAFAVTRTRNSQWAGNGFQSSTGSSTSAKGVPLIRQEQVRGIDADCEVVMLDECPNLIFAEATRYTDFPEWAERAGENPYFKTEPKPRVKKPRRKKVDEVAILKKVWR